MTEKLPEIEIREAVRNGDPAFDVFVVFVDDVEHHLGFGETLGEARFYAWTTRADMGFPLPIVEKRLAPDVA
jgi:hypothetical protein